MYTLATLRRLRRKKKYTPTASSIKCSCRRHAQRSVAHHGTQSSTIQKIKQASNKQKKRHGTYARHEQQTGKATSRTRQVVLLLPKKTSIGYKKNIISKSVRAKIKKVHFVWHSTRLAKVCIACLSHTPMLQKKMNRRSEGKHIIQTLLF